MDGTTFTTGWIDQAFQLDETNDFVEIPDSGDLDGSNFPDLTIEAWIKPANVQGSRGILTKYNTDIAFISYYLSLNSDCLQCFVGQDSNNFAWSRSDSAAVSADTFTHVAGVWDGSSLKLFVDGQEVPGALTVQGSSDNNARQLHPR